MWIRSLDREDPLEEEMAPHSSILARRTPRTEEPDGLQSWGGKELNLTEHLRIHSFIQPSHEEASSIEQHLKAGKTASLHLPLSKLHSSRVSTEQQHLPT